MNIVVRVASVLFLGGAVLLTSCASDEDLAKVRKMAVAASHKADVANQKAHQAGQRADMAAQHAN